MRRVVFIVLCALAVCQVLSAQNSGDQNRKLVDFTADVMQPIKIGDSSVLNLLGNVVFYHNGAIITCDSAIRYNDKRMECFNNVVVNKQNTYVYGNRADYNGELNTARVFAPIIKMVDDDAILYTYNFEFNTLSNIGKYSGGGTMKQKENRLESDHGYYYSDTRDVVCVRNVEIDSPDYKIKSDSVGYNMDSEIAKFFAKTYIWNSKGEILSADRGIYKQQSSQYEFTKNSYILTANKEMWSDTLDYNSVSENAVLYRDIQIRDEEHKIMGFGDFGQYWGTPGDAVLTRNPSLVSFDPQQDTLYMRADSMFLYTVSRDFALKSDSLAKAVTTEEELIENSPTPQQKALSEGEKKSGLEPAVETTVATEKDAPLSTLKVEETLDTGGEPPLSKQERKRRKQEQKALDKAADKASKSAATAPVSNKADSVGVDSLSVKQTVGVDSTLRPMVAPDKPVTPPAKVVNNAADTTSSDGQITTSTELTPLATQPVDSALLESPAQNEDSVQRILKAYRNVRIFRTDTQAVCDSMVGFSLDSTLHLYIEPVMWSDNNQITSEVVDIYTKNQELYKAVFSGGAPMMCSQVDSVRFNQVKGKVIEALFRDNDIYRTDVIGNGQTYYYSTDDQTQEATEFLSVECADITFFINDNQVETIVYRNEPVYTFYPLDKIPEEQSQLLEGFKWEIERKPTLEDVFTRTIRPSERETYEAMPKPAYPLTDAIMKNKARMIKEDIWRERNDKVSQLALDFIRSLGY